MLIYEVCQHCKLDKAGRFIIRMALEGLADLLD